MDEVRRKMARYCAYRERSSRETGKKLDEYGLIPEAKDRIMAYLMEEGFVDDLRFAKIYARGKFYHNHWGKRKILEGLKRHHIMEAYIREGMAEIDEKDYQSTVRKLVRKKCEEKKSGSLAQRKQKVASYLYSKGYAWDEFINILNDECKEDSTL